MITLKNLKDATKQEVFEQVAKHLLKQNRKSICVSRNTCMYRSFDGLACAAGCLIANDEYNPSFEGMAWAVLVNRRSVPDAHRFLITRLQSIHDGYPAKDWKHHLRQVAEEFNLDCDFIV